MDEREIILLTVLSIFVLLCAGCIESSTVNSSVETNVDSIENSTANAENMTNMDSVEDPLANTDIENAALNKDALLNAHSAEDYDISAANNAFAFDMYSQMKDRDELNLFFSPYSIFTAMSICYDGAEGSTQEQMANVFYYPMNKSILRNSAKETIGEINVDTDDYELETANALWSQEDYPLKEQYVFNAENYYYGNVEELDFFGKPESSRNTINSWIEEKTNHKISDLISREVITGDIRLIITNAIYFNGKWMTEFDKRQTQREYFYPTENERTLADTMYIMERFSYGENSKAKIIELPYKGNDLSMYVVLPNENNIEKFETTFTVHDYDELKNNMSSRYEVKTWIPKFKFESKTELSESLIEMGAIDAFQPIIADFSGISNGELFISNVIHQASVDVNEKGTEAVAVTAVVVEESAPVDYEPPVKEFKADHPFMFFIEDKRTGCILFMGKFEYPEY